GREGGGAGSSHGAGLVGRRAHRAVVDPERPGPPAERGVLVRAAWLVRARNQGQQTRRLAVAAHPPGRPGKGRAAVAGHSGGDAVAAARRWQCGGGGPGQASRGRALRAVRAAVPRVLADAQRVRPRSADDPDGHAQTPAVSPGSLDTRALAGVAPPLTGALPQRVPKNPILERDPPLPGR